MTPLHETAASPFDKHQEIINRTAGVEVLATNELNIGSLKIDTIDDMSIVPMGNRVGLEADFSNIDSLDAATPANFDAFMQKVATDEEYAAIRKKIAMLTPEQQRLELQVFFSTGLAIEFFGSNEKRQYTEEEVTEQKRQRDQTYTEDYAVDPTRDDSLRIKPLSVAGSNAMCTEYAVFVKEALRRLGTELSYFAAEKQGWPDQPSFYHSFLVSEDGKTLVDPLDTAQFYARGLPYGVFTLPGSFYESNEPVTATESWSGKTRQYALQRIHVPAIEQA
jgi:hypothetical protein